MNYHRAVKKGKPSAKLTRVARNALQHLGGDPARSNASLKDYDPKFYGPFLGISDEGSATEQIREAALESPKILALALTVTPNPMAVGVAIDAERLAGIGEVAVGPDEYMAIWLEAVDRILITTNIGTRVNMRVYRHAPVVRVERDQPAAIASAKEKIRAEFKPFIETPDMRPRPLTVFVRFPRKAAISTGRKRTILQELADFVASGKAAGPGYTTAPKDHEIGLSTWVRLGLIGKREALAAIDLAASVGMRVVILDGLKRKSADRAISLAGLLDHFSPGIVGPILRHAAEKKVRVRMANLPDTGTIARSTWAGLTTARSYGANLGKYGCFPLTLAETDEVVGQVQGWFSDWSAAPVFFVDQGLVREDAVDVGHDVVRGLKHWIKTVASHAVKLVLIDTIDKATGKRLLKKSSFDKRGFLTLEQVASVEKWAKRFRINLLWAGGMDLSEVYEMGKLGIFGVYVTTAAATTIPVAGSYVRDPSLAGVKEPSKEAVLRVKTLLEAGFLSQKLPKGMSEQIQTLSGSVLKAWEQNDENLHSHRERLASECIRGWRAFWKNFPGKRKRESFVGN